MNKTRKGRQAAACVGTVAALVLTLSACGSSSSSSSASTGSSGASTSASSTATSSGTSTEAASSGSLDLTALKATITKQQTRPTSIGITTPVKGTIPTGKTIVDIELGEPLGVSQGDDAKAAGAALGWHVIVLNAGTTPQTVQAAWKQALQDHPDGIIGTGGFPHSYYAAQLKQAMDEKIPVVEISDPAPAGNGVTVSLDSRNRYVDQGQKMAQWVMAEIGTHANVLISNVPAFTAVNTEMTTMDSYLKAHCSTCKEKLVSLAATDSNMAGDIANAAQSDPGVNVVVPATSDFSIGLPAALASIGLSKVPIMTNTQDSSYINYLKAGTVKAIYAYSTPEWVWRAFDAFARVFTHQSTAADTAHNWSQWWLTKSNVPQDLSDNAFGPIVLDYQAQFKKLWGKG